ncbi:hypothetical protein K2Z83_10720 [Oscillochloris sp. ZM17-4]|uniref:hypothetical protein n=1 Tax=Oscillochloris sp. ZM17-4 TaxID=2866714 RepID=UPI001C736150|nr:hypothetical protein [Oscillochloris sp. ZM17-4]MBX0328151.1 hypothetical protein [Oscillochloris sp. ZM17-4]
MSNATIMIPVDTATAAKYYAATEEERRKVQLLVRLLFRATAMPVEGTLQNIMDEMSDEAQTRGLTPEILNQILSEHE